VSITFLKRHIKQHGGKCTALFSSCFTQIYRKKQELCFGKTFFFKFQSVSVNDSHMHEPFECRVCAKKFANARHLRYHVEHAGHA
jgi:hypothetical protein